MLRSTDKQNKHIIVCTDHYSAKFKRRKERCIDEGENSLIYIIGGFHPPFQYLTLYAKVRIWFQLFKNDP